MSHETKSFASLADAWTKNDVKRRGTSISSPPNSPRITVHVLPGNIDEADHIAREHGYERVDDEMDRRTYQPISDDNEDH
jgi:hypothetical protein